MFYVLEILHNMSSFSEENKDNMGKRKKNQQIKENPLTNILRELREHITYP